MSKTYIYTGGYSLEKKLGSGETVPPACPGIICCEWDPVSEMPVRKSVAAKTDNPTWILADPDAPYLYCVNETSEYAGVPGGLVCAYRIDPLTGDLTCISRQFTTGEDTCHLSFSADKRYLIAANYSGGSVCVFPICEDHSLGHASCVLRHSGTGPNDDRQQGPHPHQILPAPDGQHLYAVDLGTDRMVSYYLDTAKGWLVKDSFPDIPGRPGQGLRHAVFSEDASRLYVMTEMTCEVNVYAYNRETGENELLQCISAMGGYAMTPTCLGAEIHLHPSGRFLYCSVRSSNHIAVFDVDEKGLLSLKQTIDSAGEIPRDFLIWKDGRTLLTGNQDTGTVGVYRIDQETGVLTLVHTVEDIGGVITLAPWNE